MHDKALKLIIKVLMIKRLQLKNIVKYDEYTIIRLHLLRILRLKMMIK